MSRERVLNRLEALTELSNITKEGRRNKIIFNRKDVQKRIDTARKLFMDSQQAYEVASRQLEQQQQLVDNLQNQMNTARQQVLELSDKLQTMDLSGANACKDRKDMTTYYIGGKEHAVEKGDSPLDLRIVPVKDYIRKQKEENEANDAEAKTYDDSDLTFDTDIFFQ